MYTINCMVNDVTQETKRSRSYRVARRLGLAWVRNGDLHRFYRISYDDEKTLRYESSMDNDGHWRTALITNKGGKVRQPAWLERYRYGRLVNRKQFASYDSAQTMARRWVQKGYHKKAEIPFVKAEMGDRTMFQSCDLERLAVVYTQDPEWDRGELDIEAPSDIVAELALAEDSPTNGDDDEDAYEQTVYDELDLLTEAYTSGHIKFTKEEFLSFNAYYDGYHKRGLPLLLRELHAKLAREADPDYQRYLELKARFEAEEKEVSNK